MPNVAYLLGGESPTFDKLTDLFAEADHRTAMALDNHSILYLLQDRQIEALNFFPQYLGPTFLMDNGGGPQPISGYWGTWVYDHNHFLSALAGAVQYTGTVHPVTVGNTVRINPLPISYWQQMGRNKSTDRALLSRSLEAHKRFYAPANADYWIDETYTLPPGGDTNGALASPIKLQRIRTYEQAELIWEVNGDVVFDFPARYNAFNFFRAHKLGSGTLTLRFRKTDAAIAHTLVVPAYGSKCIRRDKSLTSPLAPLTWTAVDGVYTEGFNYWQRFRSRDPRFYQHSGANNVSNPSILIPFINHVLAGQHFINNYDQNNPTLRRFAAPTVMLDPHVRAPLPIGYTSGPAPFYGNPALAATLLGDCLHHQGDLIDARTKPGNPNAVTTTRYTFTGYAGLLAGGNGLSVLQNVDDVQIKSSESGVTHDFISLSTNLICTGEGNHIQHPVINGTQFFTLDRHNPPRNISPVDRVTTPAIVSYNLVGAGGTLGAAVNQTINRQFLQLKPDGAGGASPSAGGLVPHRDTIGDVRTLKKLTNPAYPDPSNAYSTFVAEVELTASGLVVKSTQTIPLTAPFSNPNNSQAGNFIDDEWAEANLAYFLSQSVIPVLGVNTRHHMTCDGTSIVIKRATVFTGYGFPDTDNWSYTGFFSPRRTRVYRDRRTTSNPTLAQGQADFDEDRNADGYEMKYAGRRRSAILRTPIAVVSPWNAPNVYFGLGSSGTGPNQAAGTMSNNDVLYAAVNNVTVPGYWAANRARVLQNLIYRNSPLDGSDFTEIGPGIPNAARMYRYLPMELLAEHYNNLAAKVNSIVKVWPLDWTRHGVIQNGNDQTVRYRLGQNYWSLIDEIKRSSWYLGQSPTTKTNYDKRMAQLAALRPADQWCAFRVYETDPDYIIAGYAGLPVRTLADLPDNFATLQSTPPRFSVLNYVFSATITADTVRQVGSTIFHDVTIAYTAQQAVAFSHTEPAALRSRPDLAAVGKYLWVKASDVEAYALARGYKFLHAVFGAGYNLEKFDCETYSVRPHPLSFTASLRSLNTNSWVGTNLTSTDPSVGTGARSATMETRFVEFVAGSHWVAGTPASSYGIAPESSSRIYQRTHGVSLGRLPDNTFSIVLGSATPNFYIEMEFSKRLRERFFTHYIDSVSDFGDGVAASARNPVEYTTDLLCAAPLLVKWGGAAPLVLEIPQSSVQFIGDWSETSPDAYKALWQHGPGVIPFTIATGQRIVLWADFTSPV